jgi:hypothetical protein
VPLVSSIYQALIVAILSLAIVDVAVYRFFPRFDRLRYNFSAAYLARELRAASDPSVVVLGDSTLWGYGVEGPESAIGRIEKIRPRWENLTYAGGSPVNTLAMLHLLADRHIHPQVVLFNVNQKEFNSEDSAYARLHPAVEELSWGLLTPHERSEIVPALARTTDARLDRAIGRYSTLYGMRADIRDALFNESDAAHRLQDVVESLSGTAAARAAAHRPRPEDFEGTYDLTPLDATNSSFEALRQIGTFIEAQHLSAVAILTPTNHALLHDYIDSPAYQANLDATRRCLRSHGIRVLDLDAAFPQQDFIDNDHLTVAGNARLARILEREIGS